MINRNTLVDTDKKFLLNVVATIISILQNFLCTTLRLSALIIKAFINKIESEKRESSIVYIEKGILFAIIYEHTFSMTVQSGFIENVLKCIL